MFRGVHTIKLDTKYRMRIPGKYHEQLLESCEGNLVITIDASDPCLLVYPLPVWEEVERKLIRLPSLEPRSRKLQRLLIGHATETQIDANGRILLARSLRDFARIDKIVNLIGQGRKFELWSEEQWLASVQALVEKVEADDDLPDAFDAFSL